MGKKKNRSFRAKKERQIAEPEKTLRPVLTLARAVRPPRRGIRT